MHLDQITEMSVIAGVVLTGTGIFYRFVLLPNLREQLFKPVAETHRQVTENGGHNDPPTLPDKLHDIQQSVDELAVRDEQLSTAQTLMQASVTAVVLVLDEHLRWSREYVRATENGDPPPPYNPDQED